MENPEDHKVLPFTRIKRENHNLESATAVALTPERWIDTTTPMLLMIDAYGNHVDLIPKVSFDDISKENYKNWDSDSKRILAMLARNRVVCHTAMVCVKMQLQKQAHGFTNSNLLLAPGSRLEIISGSIVVSCPNTLSEEQCLEWSHQLYRFAYKLTHMELAHILYESGHDIHEKYADSMRIYLRTR